MKNILITGANSYVGTSFERWLSQWPDKYHVDTIDMLDGAWRDKSFTGYDVVFHVAGIVHQKEKKISLDKYMEINCEMAFETASKAKAERVKQFILMSTMSVYGLNGSLGKTTVIDSNTQEIPQTYYGKSKLEAERKISALSSDFFTITILRPPMVYGPCCKGNYATLEKISSLLSFYPNIHNQRSAVYIDVLCSYVSSCINEKRSGIFFPQDPIYMDTHEQIRILAKKTGKCVYFMNLLNPLVGFLAFFSELPIKAFGSLVYSRNLDTGLRHKSFVETIK